GAAQPRPGRPPALGGDAYLGGPEGPGARRQARGRGRQRAPARPRRPRARSAEGPADEGTSHVATPGYLPRNARFDQIRAVGATLPIERRPLGRSELTIPRVSLGCGNFGGVGSAPELFGQGLREDEAFALMDAAWEQGIDHFDTADAYGGGRSERMIG